MANLDAPNGFTPIRHLSGGTIRMEEMLIATDTAAAIFSGDLVTQLASGYISVGTAATVNIAGVFAGCKFTNEQGQIVYSPYWPAAQATLANADAIAYVYADPNIVFSVQTSGTAAKADIGLLMDMEDGGGSTATGRSRQEANENATAGGTPLKQIGLVNRPGNDWGANADIEVLISKHAFVAEAGVTI